MGTLALISTCLFVGFAVGVTITAIFALLCKN